MPNFHKKINPLKVLRQKCVVSIIIKFLQRPAKKGVRLPLGISDVENEKTKNRVSGRLYAQPTHPRHSKQPHYQPLHFFVFEKCREKNAQFFSEKRD